MLDRKFFRSLSNAIRKDYVNHIFNKGKDVYGRKFKGYSTNKTKWASILARKNERKKIPKEGLSYGQAKRMGILQRQESAFANKTSPVLTGDFRDDAKSSSTAGSASVKWASYGARVEHLAKMGRKVTDKRQPFPKKVIKMIDSRVDREIKKQFPKNKKVVIKIQK